MPHSLQHFRSYEIAEDPRGGSLELWRSDREVVCLASDPLRHVFVELHVLAALDLSEESAAPLTETFRRQTQALLQLDHPNVIGLRETGEDEGALFYVTRFIDGERLDSYLARCNPLPAWLAAEVAVQVTRGLLAIRDEPLLLAGVEVFHSRVALEGGMTSDLCVRLADFTLGGELPRATAPLECEHRVVRDVGRLLLYALSGVVSDRVSSRTLSALPVPTELAHLLADLLDPGTGRPTTDLAGLLAALERSRQDPALSTTPARLPQALRPRLMLQSHFPSLDELTGRLGRGYRLERTVFDAAQPYSQRAFAGDTRPVSVQLLPPARLMSPTYLPRIRLAMERVTAARSAHLLRVLELAPDDGWFIEEAPPRTSVDAALRLRRELKVAEAAILVREIDRAVLAAEKLRLPVEGLGPQQMFLDFLTKAGGPASPAEEELSSESIERWPAFRIRLRAHPVTSQFIQPHRFRRDGRLGSDGHLGGASSTASGAVLAADYAVLFRWLCGGFERMPADLARLVEQTSAGSGEPDRRRFVERLAALVPKPPKPGGRIGQPAPKPPPISREMRRKAGRNSGKDPGTAVPVNATSSGPVPAVVVAADAAPAVAESAPDFRALSGDAVSHTTGDDAHGFAEMLFGRAPRLARSGDLVDTVQPVASVGTDDEAGDLPVGALFSAGWTPDEPLDELDDIGFPESPADESPARRPGPALLVAVIILAALGIAILMAHLTGLAPWR